VSNGIVKESQKFNRDLSWLSFNYRVLQEAINEDVPLFERVKFLAIFSSNLDEFYRVRVASYQYLIRYYTGEGEIEKADQASELLLKINRIVDRHQQQFGHIFNNILIPKLRNKGVELLKEKEELGESQMVFLSDYFKEKILPYLSVIKLDKKSPAPFLENTKQYLTVKSQTGKGKSRYYIINLPTGHVNRFIKVPGDGKHFVIQLADVIRIFLKELTPNETVIHCFAVKNSRDAELYLEDEVGEDIVNKIKQSLKKRDTGEVTRFLFDENMPVKMRNFLRKRLGLKKYNMVPGGRYHNFQDFFGFPFPDQAESAYQKFPPLTHPEYEKGKSYFNWIAEKDRILHFPYQSYDHVIELLEEAADDEKVEAIKITLYRVASDSKVCSALIKAAQNGKSVLVFNEVKARFDEESNIYWGEELRKSGAKVLYSFEDLKVHTKICVIERREKQDLVRYAYLGTGNFNEKTSGIYCDHALLTKDPNLTNEAAEVFEFLKNRSVKPEFSNLLVAPFNMRSTFEELINFEINEASEGRKAEIILKMNSLEDPKMIDKIYEANNAGVKIKIIVRGICCLIPGVEGMSKNCKVISIVDRYLEHGRVYYFHHGGEKKLYLASADWMKRNLSRRVEVGFPIVDKRLKSELLDMLKFQLKDNTKARVLNKTQSNPYKKSKSNKKVRAQFDTYQYLQDK
jgi:polyphosphate kinase